MRTLGKKENYKHLGILEVDTIKQTEMKEKKKEKKIVLQTNKEASLNKTLPQKSHQ